MTEHTGEWHFGRGHVVRLPVASVHVVRSAKIAEWRDYYNLDTLLGNAPAWWIEHITVNYQPPADPES